MNAFVIGLGSIGRRHARNLAALGVHVVGFDPAPERRESLAAEVRDAKTYAGFDEGLGTGCAFAVVASPNVYHLEQALACARAGLHLFIEKPLAVLPSGVKELADEADRRRLTVLMGSNWKFHPGMLRLKELVDGGSLGKVMAVQAIGGQHLPDWHPWEDYRRMYSSRTDLGGGVLLDSHDLDYLTWLIGPLSSVACRLARTGILEIETTDLASLLLSFASGAHGTLQMDYLQRPYARRVHLTGSEGTAIWEYPNGAVRQYDARLKSWISHDVPADYDLNQMYVEEMRHFLHCMTTGQPSITPLPQARHVLSILDCARLSAEAGGGPVAVA